MFHRLLPSFAFYEERSDNEDSAARGLHQPSAPPVMVGKMMALNPSPLGEQNEFGQERIVWTVLTKLPIPAAGGYTWLREDALLYAGGTSWLGGEKLWLTRANTYHFDDDRWSRGIPLPAPMAYGAYATVGLGLEIYGGMSEDQVHRACWRMEQDSQRWQYVGDLPVPLVLARAESTESKTFIFGGCSGLASNEICNGEVWCRDRDKWQCIETMPQGPTAQIGSAVLGSRIYLFGGFMKTSNGQIANRSDAFSLDVRTGSWTALCPLPRANRGIGVVPLNSRRILLVGGCVVSDADKMGTPDDSGFTANCMLYDTVADAYENCGLLPIVLTGMETARNSKVTLSIGGEDRRRGRTSHVFAAQIRPS